MDFNSSNLAWNKSFSAPDISRTGPLFRRVIIEEQYYPHNHSSIVNHSVLSPLSPLPMGASGFPTRHFSCDQLSLINAEASNETFNSTIRTTHTTLSSTPLRNGNILAVMPQDSPMDVDLQDLSDCASSTIIKTEKDPDPTPPEECKKPTILDFVDLTFQGTTPVLKKRLSNPEMPSKRKHSHKQQILTKSTKMSFFSRTNIALFMIAVISVPIYDRLNYNRDIELNDFENELTDSLVGQPQVINDLTEAMYAFRKGSYVPEKHLVSLIGTTGVGKTHCVNIIKRKFMPKQIVEIDINTFDLTTYRDYLNLYKSVPYLVILDDLRYTHMSKVEQILNSLPENKWVLVLAVFNVQDTDDFKTFTVDEELFDKIPEELSAFDFVLRTINFESFSLDFMETHLYSFSKVYHDIICDSKDWKDLLGKHDFETFGFKGLFEKMNIRSK